MLPFIRLSLWQATIETITGLRMNYVLVAKPGDHPTLMEWAGEMRLLKEVKGVHPYLRVGE